MTAFILYQYHGCGVTQPLIKEQLDELGVQISVGQINNILVENKDRFHAEKENILSMALKLSGHINVDDTGARHKGKNGYCTHIGNDFFAWFETTPSRSRINFLKLLRCEHRDFVINDQALSYMQQQKMPQFQLSVLSRHNNKILEDETRWNNFLYGNKSELLLVLERPDIPLHNNLSERDIREYVKKRKISGSTRSDEGRRCRDTFTSLKKTCRKLDISFWNFLIDRIELQNKYPLLTEIISKQLSPAPG